jgi:hypothetical protein
MLPCASRACDRPRRPFAWTSMRISPPPLSWNRLMPAWKSWLSMLPPLMFGSPAECGPWTAAPPRCRPGTAAPESRCRAQCDKPARRAFSVAQRARAAARHLKLSGLAARPWSGLRTRDVSAAEFSAVTSRQRHRPYHPAARRDTFRETAGSTAPACERRPRPSPIGPQCIARRPRRTIPARH